MLDHSNLFTLLQKKEKKIAALNKTCPHLVLPGQGAGPQHGVLGTLDIFPVRLKLLSHARPGVRVPLEQLRRLHHDIDHAEHSPSFTVAGDSPLLVEST